MLIKVVEWLVPKLGVTFSSTFYINFNEWMNKLEAIGGGKLNVEGSVHVSLFLKGLGSSLSYKYYMNSCLYSLQKGNV